MDSPPAPGAELSTTEYWDDRYAKSDGTNATHEWFRSYAALLPFFTTHLFKQHPASASPRLLHLGSGDSTIPEDLYEAGYHNQLCVDFSPVVVDLMSERCAGKPGIEWRHADVREMPDIPESSVDVAFDKGTLDAMVHGSPWSPPETVKENVSRYMREVHRVLRRDGMFLYVTFRQPHFARPLLNSGDLWEMEMETLSDPGVGSFDYFAFIIRKKTLMT